MKNKNGTLEKQQCSLPESLLNEIEQTLRQDGIFIVQQNNQESKSIQQNRQSSAQPKQRINDTVMKIKAVFEIYKRKQIQQFYDIVIYVAVRERKTNKRDGEVGQDEGEGYQSVVVKYECLCNLKEVQRASIMECKTLGIKSKQVPMQKFIKFHTFNSNKLANLSKKQGQIHKNNTLEHRKKWAISRFGDPKNNKRKGSRSKQSSENSEDEKVIDQLIKNQKTKKINEEKEKEKKMSTNKKKLMIVSGSEDSQKPIQTQLIQQKQLDKANKKVIPKEQQKKIEKSKNNSIVAIKSKSKKKANSKDKSLKKRTNKSAKKQQQDSNRELKAIQEASFHEEISDKKKKGQKSFKSAQKLEIKQIEQKQRSQEKQIQQHISNQNERQPQKKEQEKFVNPLLSFMNKTISGQNIVQKDVDVEANHLQIDKSDELNDNESNLKHLNPHTDYLPQSSPQNTNIFPQNPPILNKIKQVQPKQKEDQNTAHKKQPQQANQLQQDKILQSLSRPFSGSLSSLKTQSQVEREKQKEKKLNQNSRANTAGPGSKKNKKNQVNLANNTTLDMFFKKKQK